MIEVGHGLADAFENRYVDDESGRKITIKQFWRNYFVGSGLWTDDIFERTWDGGIRQGPKVYHLVRVLGEISLFLPLLSDEIRWRMIVSKLKIGDLRIMDYDGASEYFGWERSFGSINTQISQLFRSGKDFIQEAKIILKSNTL
jgi:hypothetical protein